MQHIILLSALIAGIIPQLSAAPACVPGTLATYIALGTGGCSLNGPAVSSFQSLPGQNNSTQIAPQNVAIIPLTTGGAGFTVQVTASAQTNTVYEVQFAYQLSASSITASAIAISSYSTTGDGDVILTLDYCLGGQFSIPAGLIGCGATQGDLLVIAPGSDQGSFSTVTNLQAVTDFTIDGGTMGTASGGTFTNQFTATGSSTGGGSVPFGVIDTPTNNLTGVTGALPVTGWALSQGGVKTVALWRDPVSGEAPNNLIFVANASIIPGSRPDVATAYPGYPNNNYGWGVQVLTNEMPNSNGPPGIGNGTYRIHAIVTDNAGQTQDIGTKTFTANNAAATLPFGTIDTPGQGATVSGSAYVNFGWALTPLPANVIPKDGSTILVYIDNLPVGHPVYNNPRSDIATLFPGLQNSSGPVGYFVIDTTKLSNGLHTISWSVTDSAGHANGLGSRFFTVLN